VTKVFDPKKKSTVPPPVKNWKDAKPLQNSPQMAINLKRARAVQPPLKTIMGK